jgi:hypothetical protein
MLSRFDNDSLAMTLLALLGCFGLWLGYSEVAYTAVGAIGGFIGAQFMSSKNE